MAPVNFAEMSDFSVTATILLLVAAAGIVVRRRERARMRASEEASHLRLVVDHVVDGIATIDSNFCVATWNRAAERIFGRGSEAMVGQPFAMVVPGFDDESDTIRWPREALGRRKDGSLFPLELAVGEFRTGAGRHFTAIFRDITERKSADDNLRLAKIAADEASQAKSRFLANMSHEIRTPLGALLGFSELLVGPVQTEEERGRCISAIRRNGDLLSNIINDILDLSRVEAGKVQIEKHTVRIEEVITDISSLLGLQAREKGIHLSVRYDGPVPMQISTDPLRLRQILVNIVGNAIKFTTRGEVVVTIRGAPRATGSTLLAFDVADTGPGISAALASRLFNPFAQGDSSRTRSMGGAGLGLVLARRLAQLLGGDVALTRTEVGKGSVFTISVDPGETTALAPVPELTPATKREINASLDGLRILLVDDSPDNQILIAKFLAMAGATVLVANNGREGFEMAIAQDFDLVVMDIQMPVMDGYEAVTRLRECGYDKPVVALTAHALKEEQERCLACGFDGHLSKPINRQVLVDRLVTYAHRHVSGLAAAKACENAGVKATGTAPGLHLVQ